MTLVLEAVPSTDRRSALADAAVDALIAEAELTPKPGLVDRRGSGAHADMDLDVMIASALALRGTFRALADCAESGLGGSALRGALAEIGRGGERTMLHATHGVNTHRGAIWALGLAVAAAAARPDADAAEVLTVVASIAAHDDPAAPVNDNPGARVRARFGIGGAVAEARAGFPHAAAALAELRGGRRAGLAEQDARVNALVASMAGLEDTCLIARGGPEALERTRTAAADALRRGGSSTRAGRRALLRLDAELAARHLSPGGSADMLALALFLDALRPRTVPGKDTPCRH